MAGFRKMIDMARSAEEKAETIAAPSVDKVPDYPFGLSISLDQKDLDKLGLEADCEVGDMIDLRALARVTSVSKREYAGESECRIELQIEQLAVEDEDDEAEDDEAAE